MTLRWSGLRDHRQLAAAALVALVIASCSGDDSDTRAPTSPAPTTSAAPTTTSLPSTVSLDEIVAAPSCSVDGEVADLTVANGTVYFVGDFASVTDSTGRTEARPGIAACDLVTGELDAFAVGIEGESTIRTVAWLDEMVLLGGSFELAGSAPRTNFVAVDARDGSVVEDWGPTSVRGGVAVVDVGRSGSVYLGGTFRDVDGERRSGAARLGPDGALDTEFKPSIEAGEMQPRIAAFAESGTDRVYIGGDFETLNDTDAEGIGAVDFATGTSTEQFSPQLSDTNPEDDRVQIRTVIVDESWVYLCGDWWTTEGRGDREEQRNVGRFTDSGVADATFEPWTDGGVRDCLIHDDQLVLAGHFDQVSGVAARKTARVSLVDAEVQPLVQADTPKGVQVVAVADDRLVIGGTFSRVDGTDQPGLAIFATAG